MKPAEESNTGGLVRFGPVGAHIEDGDSGGPVFDSEGQLIGVLSGRDLDGNNEAYFVPIAAGASLLFNVAQIHPCHELGRIGRAQTGGGSDLAEAIAEMRCVTDSQIQALSGQIEIIFINNQIQRIKDGDLKEDPGSGLTQYDLEQRMRDARKEVETMLEPAKDGKCN